MQPGRLRTSAAGKKLEALSAETDQLARRNIQLRDQNDRLAVEIARLGSQAERLASEIARLRASPAVQAAEARNETEQQMAALKTELLSLLNQLDRRSAH